MHNESTDIIKKDKAGYINYCPGTPGANGPGRAIINPGGKKDD